ncbi:MAG: alkaline phosphatase family protein [Candidatus Xenobia bacterium]
MTKPGPVPRSILPDYEEGGIVAVPRRALKAFGVDAGPALPLPSALLDGVRSVVLVVVDGLGWHYLQRRLEQDDLPGFREAIQRGVLTSLTSVLPSTTTAALTTFSTGVTPQQHGILGYRLLLREVGMVSNMIAFSPAIGSREYPTHHLDCSSFVPVESVYQRLKASSVSSTVHIWKHYQGSALSKMLYRGADIKAYVANHDSVPLLCQSLLARKRRPHYYHLYYDEMDVVQHQYGPESPIVAACLDGFDHALSRHLLRLSAPDTLVMVTADHGHVHTTSKHSYNLREHPDLMQMLMAPPCGDARLPYLYVRPDTLEAAEALLKERFGETTAVLRGETLLREGWFGSGAMHAEARSRVGHLVLVPQAPWKFTYPSGPDDRDSLGRHGGLDEDEMRVPLLAFRL